jgi:hypothetical protein
MQARRQFRCERQDQARKLSRKLSAASPRNFAAARRFNI